MCNKTSSQQAGNVSIICLYQWKKILNKCSELVIRFRIKPNIRSITIHKNIAYIYSRFKCQYFIHIVYAIVVCLPVHVTGSTTSGQFSSVHSVNEAYHWMSRQTAVCEDQGSNLTADGSLSRMPHCDMQPWGARAAHFYCSAYVNSALHPSGVAKSSTSFGWG